MWSWSSRAWPTAPHGAVGTHITYFTDDLSRSENDRTFAGLSAGVASTMTLVAKILGVEAWADFALSIVVVSAVASTSAGAPCVACWASVAEESNANLTVTPSCSCSNSFPSSVKVPVSDDAASTVMVVLSFPPPQAVNGRTVRRAASATARRRVSRSTESFSSTS